MQLFFLKTGLSRGVPLAVFGDFCPYKSHPSETDTSHQIDGAFVAAPAARRNLNKASNSNSTRYMTLKELMARLQTAGVDISCPALSLLEGQKRPVSDIELNALADILHVSVAWLLGREK